MLGESSTRHEVGSHGLEGDRAYALIDAEDGKVVTAKNPKKWPNMFAFSSRLREGASGDALEITLPDGTTVEGSRSDLDSVLSRADGSGSHAGGDRVTRHATRAVGSRPASGPASGESHASVIEYIDHKDIVHDFEIPAGTFFDWGTVHLVTTATLERMERANPGARFDRRRFRPNLVLDVDAGDFDERSWAGQTLAIGDEVRLEVTVPTIRCIMTTLAQADLPIDPTLLRAIVKQNQSADRRLRQRVARRNRAARRRGAGAGGRSRRRQIFLTRSPARIAPGSTTLAQMPRRLSSRPTGEFTNFIASSPKR